METKVAVFLFVGLLEGGLSIPLILWQTIQVSLGNAGGLGAAFMPLFLTVVLGTVGIFTYKAIRSDGGEEA